MLDAGTIGYHVFVQNIFYSGEKVSKKDSSKFLSYCFIRGMNSKEISRIVERIRVSGCLSDRELQRQVAMVNGWESLMRIDQWDRWWEEEVKNHVCWAAKLGKRHVPSTSDVVAFCVFGLISGSYGVFLVSQIGKGINDNAEVRWFAGGILVVACLLLVQAVRSFLSMRKYKPMLQMYEEGRSGELARLAGEHRPGARICLKCLKYTA